MTSWEKPVIIFYKERLQEPERKAFVVIKARKLQITVPKKEGSKFLGNIKDFFPLMGDIDYISSDEGTTDRYVLCWFDDDEDDFGRAWRRLAGVTFPDGITYVTSEKGKKTYNASFIGEYGKLE